MAVVRYLLRAIGQERANPFQYSVGQTETQSESLQKKVVVDTATPATITQYVAWMERQFNACQSPRSMYLSIFNSFRVVRYLSQCVSPKIAIFTYHSRHFCFSWRCPCDYDEICCMDGKTIQCLPNQGSMYPSIFNIFRVIPTASAKNCRFHVPQLTFLFPLETPLRLLRNVLHGWKDNSMLAKPLAAYSYLSSIVSELYDA